MTDHRISVIRDALIKCHGLYVSDFEIRTLLAALDKIGAPLPAAQTITLGEPAEIDCTMADLFGDPMSPDEATQKPMGAGDFIADMLADARAYDEARGLL